MNPKCHQCDAEFVRPPHLKRQPSLWWCWACRMVVLVFGDRA